ncbi:PAS domain-containing sensor histidine kinase [Kiloniella sp.]|uniref:PAS domain-containing sensor histidine kinase n=1 Tax=Kiloniella sp. TaxID=1938587 RepID=UPI003B01F241
MKRYDDLVFDRQTLLDAFPLPVFISDDDQLFIAGNKEFHTFIGKAKLPEGFRIPMIGFTPYPEGTVQQLDNEVLKTGVSKSIELSLERADGVQCQVLLRKTRLIDPNPIEPPRILNTLQDITEQHLAQNILLDAVDSIAEAFAMYDNRGELVLCNQNFRDMYGYTEEQARPGVHFQELGEIDIKNGNVAIGDEAGEDYLERKAAYRRELQGSFTVNLKDGRWIRTTDRRVPGLGFVSVQSDITAIKESQNLLTNAKETAEFANRAKTEFLANMSHELRTPLNSIIGFSQILMGEMFGNHSNKKYKDYSEAINRSSNHLLELISEILDQSKIELGTVTVEAEPVDVSVMLDECLTLMNERSEKAHVEVTLECDDKLPKFSLDRLKVKQTVLNLLTNAIKFTDPDGTVSINARQNSDCDLIIEVQDTGIGISVENIDRVLEPFAQVAESKTRNHEGTGLGLSIAKSFTELHNGTLMLESSSGDGTTVTLCFPSEFAL